MQQRKQQQRTATVRAKKKKRGAAAAAAVCLSYDHAQNDQDSQKVQITRIVRSFVFGRVGFIVERLNLSSRVKEGGRGENRLEVYIAHMWASFAVLACNLKPSKTHTPPPVCVDFVVASAVGLR